MSVDHAQLGQCQLHQLAKLRQCGHAVLQRRLCLEWLVNHDLRWHDTDWQLESRHRHMRGYVITHASHGAVNAIVCARSNYLSVYHAQLGQRQLQQLTELRQRRHAVLQCRLCSEWLVNYNMRRHHPDGQLEPCYRNLRRCVSLPSLGHIAATHAYSTAITCPSITLNSGSVSYSNLQNYGSVATLSCSAGFALSGSSTTTCGGTAQTGSWSPTIATCVGRAHSIRVCDAPNARHLQPSRVHPSRSTRAL
jgi:hypothetical protein